MSLMSEQLIMKL